ncbi:MAG TPA: AAA family ATPase [Candidatus Saccharimonadia bacterium]|nr:AAA family ATPase [Candidatus Saccharimonadia bacterium]
MRLLLHHVTERQLATATETTAGSYVFHGPRGVGKATAARELARRLNCRGDEGGDCAHCRQFEAGAYPDFIWVQPEGRASVTIEQVRQLGHSLTMTPYYAEGKRLVVIDRAEALTVEAQNALLKLIEEPPPRTHFVLVAEQLGALLPTMCSRLVPIYFAPLPAATIAELLESQEGLRPVEATRLAALAAGAPGQARRLATDPAAAAVLSQLDEAAVMALSASLFDRLVLARRLADAKAELPLLAGRLQQSVLGGLRQGSELPALAASRLGALERFRRGLTANVGARVALERLMLEL